MSAKTVNLIMKMFPQPAYAVLTEVPNATAGAKARTADAIAIGCWPSRGMTVTGFEVKASRSDWLKELQTPEKSTPLQKYCDAWYLATENDAIADITEIPEQWGWISISNGRLKTKKAAPVLSPLPIDRNFLASLARRLTIKVGVDKLLSEKFWEGREQGRKEEADKLLRMKEQLDKAIQQIIDRIDRFEKASGIRIDDWNGPRIAEAVARLKEGGSMATTIGRMAHDAQQEADALRLCYEQLNGKSAQTSVET